MTSPKLSRDRRDQVDRVVAGILEDMVSGRWVAGRSHQELATREGVSVDRVKDWAAEAGRTLRLLALVDRDDLRARNAARLDAISADAHRDGEYGDAVRAIAEQGKLLGLNAPERSEVTVKAPAPAQDPRERLEQVIGAIKALEAEADRLRDALAIPVSADVDG